MPMAPLRALCAGSAALALLAGVAGVADAQQNTFRDAPYTVNPGDTLAAHRQRRSLELAIGNTARDHGGHVHADPYSVPFQGRRLFH